MNMKILKVTRTESLVRFRHELTLEGGGVEERDITAHEAPLKKFDTCLAALGAVAAKVLELPNEWAAGISVHSLSISYTKAGTRSATIGFKKALDATSTNHGMDTPAFQVDDAGDGEEGRRQCAKRHAEMVLEMIECVEEYANGKRQQMQLPLGGTAGKKGEGDTGGGTLALFPEGREPGKDGKDTRSKAAIAKAKQRAAKKERDAKAAGGGQGGEDGDGAPS